MIMPWESIKITKILGIEDEDDILYAVRTLTKQAKADAATVRLLLEAINMTPHELEMERSHIELAPREWLRERMARK